MRYNVISTFPKKIVLMLKIVEYEMQAEHLQRLSMIILVTREAGLSEGCWQHLDCHRQLQGMSIDSIYAIEDAHRKARGHPTWYQSKG